MPVAMPNRFVILHHRVDGGEHWDMMLEHGDVLLTWQLLTEPRGTDCLPITARRIRDHRKAYLEYEGPIGEDRGDVRRIDSGGVEIEEFTGESCCFRLSGGRMAGSFSLRRNPSGSWTFAPTGV